jgi:hypothetical protein
MDPATFRALANAVLHLQRVLVNDPEPVIRAEAQAIVRRARFTATDVNRASAAAANASTVNERHTALLELGEYIATSGILKPS